MTPRPAYVIDQMISANPSPPGSRRWPPRSPRALRAPKSWSWWACLRGSFIFIADLVREIDLPVEVDFWKRPATANSMHSSREVRILKDLRGEIGGRDVLVVEDIVDTGFTLHHVLQPAAARQPRRLEVCALLDKPSRREVDIKATWTGFEIPDEFVVGYGIDCCPEQTATCHIISASTCALPDLAGGHGFGLCHRHAGKSGDLGKSG
jgi:hypoxanthine phosphoribosyltransferase